MKTRTKKPSFTYSTFVKFWLVTTWSVRLARISHSGAISNPLIAKNILQIKEVPKLWVLSKNHSENLDKINEKFIQCETTPENKMASETANKQKPCERNEKKY